MAMEVQEHRYSRECAPFKDVITEESKNIALQSGSNGLWELDRLQNSSRIVRVSRSSGGKDRHSKVWTSRGLRDRRIRLSLNTAIQFYDLQDRLGYDQPSKAVEWLIKAAADPISELPSLKSYFSAAQRAIPPETVENQLDLPRVQSNNHDSYLNKPIPDCNIVSDTEIESGFHICRSKLAEKAEGAFLIEKGGGKEVESRILSRVGGNVSFTELLTNGMSTSSSKEKLWSAMAVDYFGIGSFGDGNSVLPRYSISTGHLLSVPSRNCNNYNLNFTVSPNFQPNLSSTLPQLQSMPYSDSSNNSFLFGDAAPVQTHQLLAFDSRLQLCNSESRDWGQNEKMKN